MKRTSFGFALILAPMLARAEIVATCGASAGHAYYPPSALVPKDKSGWLEDSISKGSFQLIRNGADYDIVFTDASGGTVSSKGDGGSIAAVTDKNGNLLVNVYYPEKVLETYIFWFAVKSEKAVTFSQAKFGATIPKHSLMKSICKW